MKKENFIKILKILIFILPLPFGCVGRIFSPLFYLIIGTLSLMVLSQRGSKLQSYGAKDQDMGLRTKDYGNKQELVGSILYKDRVKAFLYVFLFFLGFQIIPLPIFVLKVISPRTVFALSSLKDSLPSFHSISLVPFDTLIFSFKFLVFCFFFLSLIYIRFQKKDILSIFNAILLSSVIQVFFGLLKYAMGNKDFFLFFYTLEEKNIYVHRLKGTLANPDHFAFFLLIILPIGLSLFFRKIKFLEDNLSIKDKIILTLNADRGLFYYFIALILIGLGIILTGSRSAIITMLLIFLIFAQFSVYLRGSKAMRKKLKFIFFAISALAIFIGIQHTVKRFVDTGFESSGRLLRWPNTISMVSDFPVFGTGFGTYRFSYYLYDTDEGGKWSTHAHNEYLENFSEGGVVGFILFLIPILLIVYSIVKMLGKRRHPDVKMLGIGIMTSFFAAAFHSFFDFSLRIPSNIFILVLIAGLGVQIAMYKRSFYNKGDYNEK